MASKQKGYTFFDVLSIGCGLFAAIWGARQGHALMGTPGGVAGFCIMGLMGFFLGRSVYVILLSRLGKQITKETTPRLSERMRSRKEDSIFTLLLAELLARGEDVDGELPLVMELLKSDVDLLRQNGWEALKMAFPEIAARMAGYHPSDPVEKCRVLVAQVTKNASEKYQRW